MDPLLIISPSNKDLFSESNYELFQIPETTLSFAIGTMTIKRRVKKLMSAINAKHPNSQVYLPAFHPWNIHFIEWANVHDLKSIVTIHDFHTHAGEHSALIENMQKKCIRKATTVVFLSEFVRAQAIQELGESEKYVVHAHPILDARVKNTLPYNPKPNILFLGRVVKYKGVDMLMEAISDLNINKLTIAGEQSGMDITSTEKINVINKRLDEGEIQALLVSHEIMVLPYREATQSGILTLGMSAGMAMVVTRVGGLMEQLGEDGAVWVEASVSEISQGVKKLINEKSVYDALKKYF